MRTLLFYLHIVWIIGIQDNSRFNGFLGVVGFSRFLLDSVDVILLASTVSTFKTKLRINLYNDDKNTINFTR